MLTRRGWLAATGGAVVAALAGQRAWPTGGGTGARMVVYKSPTCGCCGLWIDHVKRADFAVEVRDVLDAGAEARRHGVPERLMSCHVALVGGYAVEGHVPAREIVRLLRERPAIAGIAVAGMPNGAPGMEQGGRDAYDVIAFTKDGTTSVFASYPAGGV